MTKNKKTAVILCILDGWGHRNASDYNAIKLANTPVFDQLWETFPHALLETSGEAVGLPKGQMGNSEVGHLNIGAGRIVQQDLPKINALFESGILLQTPSLKHLIQTLKKTQNAVHLMGVISDGGVHAHQTHFITMANFFAKAGIETYLHAFFDGRDVGPKTALQYITFCEKHLENTPNLKWATGMGRFYSMDRDHRYERTQKAYNAIYGGKAVANYDTLEAGIQAAYDQNVTDEFIHPYTINNYAGIKSGDALCMLNFRADRARQLLDAMLNPNFTAFETGTAVKHAIGFSSYSEALDKYVINIIPKTNLKNTLSEVLSKNGKTQLHLAETEKYPHVTYFFNGGEEQKLPGETRCLIPSPKVTTYDLQPEMSAYELTETCIETLKEIQPDFTIINFANPDMVGHCGKLEPAIKAVETVDICLGKLLAAIQKIKEKKYHIFITADHGNCEEMYDTIRKMPHTAHTVNPVPAILFSTEKFDAKLQNGKLCDIAPTILALLGLKQPREMTGSSLILK